jgi:hypothetical protein
MSFDIVIPVGPNDFDIISTTIEYTKKNVIGYRNIYIVSKILYNIQGCITIDEAIFPYNINDIGIKIGCQERAGWYLQQLIKLTASIYIPDILDNYLVLDSDVFILKPTEFIKSEIPLYAFGDEHHLPYFDHMYKLHPSLSRQQNISGICHHMMFNKSYILELFTLVEKYKNKKFIECFIDEVVEKGPHTSGASEYEIYFNFMIKYHSDKIIIRSLNWRNLRSLNQSSDNDDFVAVHHYIRDI